MQAIFYTFTKRINSTAVPASGGTSYNIILKEDSGLLQPEIFLKWTGSGSPCAFNYVHIPDFQRYYWISNWTYSERQWGASLSVDVLASWRAQIGAAEKYILRSYAESDPLVLDTLYPAKGEAVWSSVQEPMTDHGIDISSGCYVVGITGRNSNGSIGGITYYVMFQSELTQLLNNAFTAVEDMISNSTTGLITKTSLEDIMIKIGEITYRGTNNISQFINSVMWVPFSLPVLASTATVDVYLGLVRAGVGHVPYTNIYELSFGISATALNIGAPRWPYLEPYSQYSLYWAPVGKIPLDGASLASYGSVYITMYFDLMSGIVRIVYGYSALNPAGEASAQLGVPIAVHGQWFDYGAALNSVLSLGVDVASMAITGVPDIGSLANVGNMAKAFSPQAVGSGRSGGRSGISAIMYLQCARLSHVPEDIIENGRPLCAVRQISALSGGYVLCRDGDIQAPCTDGELEQISQFLTGGFFYE